MSKTAKRIPISDAKAIGEKCGYNLISVLSKEHSGISLLREMLGVYLAFEAIREKMEN